jgi:hypothetical protein
MLMVLVLLAVCFTKNAGAVQDIFLDAVPMDSNVVLSMARYWAMIAARSLSRAAPALQRWHGSLWEMRSEPGFRGETIWVKGALRACGVRDPPRFDSVVWEFDTSPDGWHEDLAGVVKTYSNSTVRFLVGTPSQDRQ